MRFRDLALRSLSYYWRTNVAVIVGVATAVAVLAGALLVGDSVRGSLRDLVTRRLGAADHVIVSAEFFRDQLAGDISADESFARSFTRAVPLIVLPGVAGTPESARRVGRVRVYGVDARFWRFHGLSPQPIEEREALLSRALATELSAVAGNSLLVRVQRPSEVPLESLHSRKEDLGRTLNLRVRGIVPTSGLGDFSLDPQQGDVRAVFVPLSTLQGELELADDVNTILAASRIDGDTPGAVRILEGLVRRHATLDDAGLTLTAIPDRGVLSVGSRAGLLTDAQSAAIRTAAEQAGMTPQPILTYLGNTIRHGDREIPYSLVSALDLQAVLPAGKPETTPGQDPPIVLNEWAASELGAKTGSPLTMEYYLWEDAGRLATRSASFQVAGIVPVTAGDRALAPDYPGITDSPTLGDWDPPFPIDLRRIRPADEAYWEQYRTTPKAFIPLEVGERLWQSRYGGLTSVRLAPPAGQSVDEARLALTTRLARAIDPLAVGLAVRDVRGSSLAASRGATDFGAYFVYFSFFIVVSAILLAALFFKLGIEQRAPEVGLLRAVGLPPNNVRGLFLREGALLATVGSAIGVVAAIGYAALVMAALRSWWIDAVGTNALTLHVSALSLAIGAAGGLITAFVCIWWTLRSLTRISERSLLAGEIHSVMDDTRSSARGKASPYVLAGIGLAGLGAALMAASAGGLVPRAGAFFGAGSLFLASVLCVAAAAFRVRAGAALSGRGWLGVSRLGFRNTTYRPGRSVLSIAVVAAATFILIAVDAFRRDAGATGPAVKQSGVGGYALLVETLLPIVHDPNTPEGRRSLNLQDLDNATLEPFRLLPGDDASCLNLYVPQNPRILAPRDSFLAEGRFVFQDSLAATDAERANPWLLLQRELPDGAVPVVADANSMTYVLHRQIGDDIVLQRGGRDIRLRLVAALRDSILQGELLMAQAKFLELFPEEQGYRFLLVETPAGQASDVATRLEDALADLGADATGTAERLATFHRVENTYLSTFQTLGGLGLLLGTIGLAAVMMRNAVERRRELGLLGAVGYERKHFMIMAAAENALLLTSGLAAGALSAAIAIAPAVAERGGRTPFTAGGALLLFAIFVTGVLSSIVATRVIARAPILDRLRAD